MGRRVNFTIMNWFVEKRLFLVRELGDGSLTLCLPQGVWSVGSDVAECKDVHISAHTSRAFNGKLANRVKRTALTKDGDRYESHIIVTDKKKRGFIWPMTSALNGLRSAREFTQRAGDESIPLIGYTGPEESMCYTVYAHDIGVTLPQVQGFSHHRQEFSELALTIYVTFHHRGNAGVQLHYEEGGIAMLKNGVAMTPGPYRGREILAPRMTENGIEKYLQRTQISLIQAFASIKDPRTDEGPFRSPHPGGVNRWPTITDAIHRDYGVMSINRNPIYDNPRDVNGRVKAPEERYRPAHFAVVEISDALIADLPAEHIGMIKPEIRGQLEDHIGRPL